MFQFSRFAFRLRGISRLHRDGLPHSEISGSMRMCRSPKLIAAYHVLLRLSDPRHPPYALNRFRFLISVKLKIRFYLYPICQRTFDPKVSCGGERSRTDDPLLAKQVL